MKETGGSHPSRDEHKFAVVIVGHSVDVDACQPVLDIHRVETQLKSWIQPSACAGTQGLHAREKHSHKSMSFAFPLYSERSRPIQPPLETVRLCLVDSSPPSASSFSQP